MVSVPLLVGTRDTLGPGVAATVRLLEGLPDGLADGELLRSWLRLGKVEGANDGADGYMDGSRAVGAADGAVDGSNEGTLEDFDLKVPFPDLLLVPLSCIPRDLPDLLVLLPDLLELEVELEPFPLPLPDAWDIWCKW